MTKIDQTAMYSQACDMFRHYSNASFLVRSAAVVQSFALLVPWNGAVVAEKPDVLFTVGIPIVGLIFTALLYRFHLGYYRSADFFNREASRLEQQIEGQTVGPMTSFISEHDGRYSGKFGQLLTLDSPFAFGIVLFVVAAFIAIAKWL